MNKFIWFFIGLIIVLFAVLFYFYYIEIYEVSYQVEYLRDKESNIIVYEIESYPLNASGTKALFRKADFSFKILEGFENIEDIYKIDEIKLQIYIRDEFSNIVVELKSDYSRYSSIIELPLKEYNKA